MLHCACMVDERRQMETLMEKTVNEWPEMEDKEKVVVVDKVCKY